MRVGALVAEPEDTRGARNGGHEEVEALSDDHVVVDGAHCGDHHAAQAHSLYTMDSELSIKLAISDQAQYSSFFVLSKIRKI